MSTKLDYTQVIKASYDEVTDTLRTTNVGPLGMSGPMSKLDFPQIIKSVFDESTNSLRVSGGGGGGGGVDSVNGQTGIVQIDGIDIPYENSISGLLATDVQAAIDELKAITDRRDTEAIYVDANNGDDLTGTGGILNPVASIDKAVSLATNPSLNYVIRVGPGTYTGPQIEWPANADLIGSGSNSTNIQNPINYTAQPGSSTGFNMSLVTLNLTVDFTNASIAMPYLFNGSFGITRTDTQGSGPWVIQVSDSTLGECDFNSTNLLSNCLFVSTAIVRNESLLLCNNTTIGIVMDLEGNAQIKANGCTISGLLNGIPVGPDTPTIITDASSLNGTSLNNMNIVLADNSVYVSYDNTTSGLSSTNVQDAIDEIVATGTSTSWGNITGTLADQTDLQTALNTYVPLAQKGANNGVATLDAGGKIPSSQIPAMAITETFVVASEVAMLALDAQTGDIAIRSDVSETFILQGTDPSVLGDWVQLQTPASAVLSVNGEVGAVSLDTTDIPEGSNLYFTDARARTAAVVNSTAGSETNQAPSVLSMKTYVNDSISASQVDNTFRISDDVDNTKKIAFEATNILTNTTRTIVMPDSSLRLIETNPTTGAIINDLLPNNATTSLGSSIPFQQWGTIFGRRGLFYRRTNGTGNPLELNGLTNAETTPSGSLGSDTRTISTLEKLTIFTNNQTGVDNSNSIAVETGNTDNGNSGNVILRPGVPTGSGVKGVIDVTSSLISNVLNPVNNQDAATKSYVDNAVSGVSPEWGNIVGTLADQTDLQNELDSKVNRSLSNLESPTAINVNLLPNGPINLGSNSARFNDAFIEEVRSGALTGHSGQPLNIQSFDNISIVSDGYINNYSQDKTSADNSGYFRFKSGNVEDGNSGYVELRTGQAINGQSGSLQLITGSSENATAGDIVLNSGSTIDGTAGNIILAPGIATGSGTAGWISANNSLISDVATPVNSTDAVNKLYVDTNISSTKVTVTINPNQTNANAVELQYNRSLYDGCSIVYKIKDTTTDAVRCGTLVIANNSSSAVLSDMSTVETGPVGVSFDATAFGPWVRITYTSDSNNYIMKAVVTRIEA